MKNKLLLLVAAAAFAVCGSCHASPPADTPRTSLTVEASNETPAPAPLPVIPAPLFAYQAAESRVVLRATPGIVFTSFSYVGDTKPSFVATATAFSGKGETRTRFHSVAPFAMCPVY